MVARWVMVCDQDTAPVPSSGGGWTCANGQVVQADAVVQSVSSMPQPEDVAALWGAAFSTVLVCFVVGRGVGALLELIKKG